MMTAVTTRISPAAESRSKPSPKWTTPTSTAVRGSIEPRIEVIVEPICLIASTSVRLESTVGSRASNSRLRQMCHVWTTAMPDVERA